MIMVITMMLTIIMSMTSTAGMIITPMTTRATPIIRMITMIMATTIMVMTISMTTTSTTIMGTTITATAMDMRVSAGDQAFDHAALFRLMTWLSPAFPVGAFSYSSGIEWAVEAGDITDAATLKDWLAAMLTDGAGLCDGIFLAHTWRAIDTGDDTALAGVAELSAAFVPSRERHLETTAQGRAFLDIATKAWDCDALHQLKAVANGPVTYPVAVGTLTSGHGLPLDASMHAFLHAQVSNWISAGVRLIPLGQTDSQRVLASLEPVIAATAERALAASLDDLGSATFRADIASMRHETQYTRLFRS
jgi:urease accessory protein